MTERPTPDEKRNPVARVLFAILRAVLTVVIVFDEIARPLYRPLIDWVASLRIVARMEVAIARQSRLAILALLAVPFALAEPLKLLGLVMMADGRLRTGLVVFAFAHLVSFLLVERIYHAGRDKLLTYGWLSWLMTLLDRLRRRALDWVRSSAAYAFAIRARDAARAWWRGLRA
ncbi:hypothetical protein [Bosea vaviloviae]|uniref:Uncharacterized protein n=1 Tax=Bosea vaviloviae TaxID=1526658 RepID=A0A0N0M8U1_9HYPH|nr:hypothetical protein [Bosea vaviloviae]KPH76731.1 hypothetical protein AE618_23130 [Bosea vaviloviae]